MQVKVTTAPGEWPASAQVLKNRLSAVGQAAQAQVNQSLMPKAARSSPFLTAPGLVSLLLSEHPTRLSLLQKRSMKRAAADALNIVPENVQMTAYEQQRADNMARNARVLNAMGLGMELSQNKSKRQK